MTPDEMRKQANYMRGWVSESVDKGTMDPGTLATNQVLMALWLATAEICERLDKLSAEQALARGIAEQNRIRAEVWREAAAECRVGGFANGALFAYRCEKKAEALERGK